MRGHCMTLTRGYGCCFRSPSVLRPVGRAPRSARLSRSYGGGGGAEGRRPGLWRPAAFTIVVGLSAYSLSAVYREELRRMWVRGTWPHPPPVRREGLWSKMRAKWSSVSPANRFALTIIGVNAGVFLLWRVPALHRVMERYFLSSVANRNSFPLLLSVFSHMEFWHLGLNMLVLWSFSPPLLQTLGDGASPLNAWPYFITAGVFASMVGHYSRVLRRSPLASLGASGALMAAVSLVVFNHPHSHVYVIFLPFIPIQASWALAGVVTMDLIGLVRGWQMFDHAGHLGGVLFALLYNSWLEKVIARGQMRVWRRWQKMRTRWGGGKGS